MDRGAFLRQTRNGRVAKGVRIEKPSQTSSRSGVATGGQKTVIYIGIDPGLAATGVAAIVTNGNMISCPMTRTLKTPPGGDTQERIAAILKMIDGAIYRGAIRYDYEIMAIEVPITQFTPGKRNLMGLIGTATLAGAVFGSFCDTKLIPPTAWLRGKSLEYRHQEFRTLTGYKEKCSNHARDAACIALAVALGRV